MASKKIAVIPGDGIGPEVIEEGVTVLSRALALVDISVEWSKLPWGSQYFKATGRMMPDDALRILATFDAIYFGAVGDPDIPDHITSWGLTLAVRQAFNQCVNYRPVRWFPGVAARLVGKQPEDVNMVFIRENVEGEYVGIGGRLFSTSSDELAVQTAVFTKRGIDRAARYAFNEARRSGLRLTSVTKSNALQHSMVLWDEVIAEVAADYPDVAWERMHVDAVAYNMVIQPERFQVVLASNLFGDILSDLGAAVQGSLGLAASGNIDPSRQSPSLFEPVHGSAPDIAGKGIANPGGAIWSGALMLEHLGLSQPASLVMRSLERTLSAGVLTRDLGGDQTTSQFARAVTEQLVLVAELQEKEDLSRDA